MRIRDQQAATRSDYSDLLGHSSGSGDMCLKLLAADMAATPHLKCKFSTAHHLTGILHLVLIQIEQAAQPHESFQASVTPAGDIRLVQSKDSGYERTSGCDRDHRVFTHSGDRDFKKKHPSDQRSGS